MKHIILIIGLGILMMMPAKTFSHSPNEIFAEEATGIVENITAIAFRNKLSETLYYQLIDVRSPEEFQEGHLKGAKLINFYASDFEKNISALDKNKPVMVYCQSGNRSGQAAAKMNLLGFKLVYNMKGGINAWKGANLPLEK